MNVKTGSFSIVIDTCYSLYWLSKWQHLNTLQGLSMVKGIRKFALGFHVSFYKTLYSNFFARPKNSHNALFFCM